MGSWSWLIVLHGLPDPAHVFADLCVDTRLFGDSTWILAPGDNALKRPVTDQRAPRVALGMGRERKPVRRGGLPGEGRGGQETEVGNGPGDEVGVIGGNIDGVGVKNRGGNGDGAGQHVEVRNGKSGGDGFGISGGGRVRVGDEIEVVNEDVLEVGDGDGDVVADPGPAL